MAVASGTHEPRFQGAWIDDALDPGQFVIVPDDGLEYVCANREELFVLLARDYVGRCDFWVRWKAPTGSMDYRRAGELEPGWGAQPAA